MNEQKQAVVAPELPTGKTNHAELEAAGWTFPTDRKGRKGQVGQFRVDGQIVAVCKISNQGFAELI